VVTGVAQAAAQTISIGVDHSTPSGHNFEYTDFFPRTGVTIHSGDVVDFGWASTPDGFHTATVLKNGETPNDAWSTVYPFAQPDADDGAGQLQLNPKIGPSNPPPGSGAPGACGDATTPCAYDGSTDVNSGPNGTDGASHFFVQVNAAAGSTIIFVCLIHPGMAGSLSVADPATTSSTASDVSAAAQSQADADTSAALAKEAAVNNSSSATNADGTHTITMTAGTAVPYVEIAEMLPNDVQIAAGDTVNWVTTTIADPHTVTFPLGDDPSTEPIPSVCEGTGSTDGPFNPGAPGPPCGDPTMFETHLNPAPSGGTVISATTTVATSGIIGTPPGPFPNSYAFSFPASGSFTYQCRIHDHMTGTVTVLAATTSQPAAPVAAQPTFTG
jgi:plastocyanin